MAKKPFRQLSAATQRRIRSYAAKEGLSVRQVRASAALSQAARGHGAATPSRAGGLGESAARRATETHRAVLEGRMTSAEVQKVRTWFRRRAVQIDKTAADGERAYRSVINELKRHPYQTWEAIRDHIEFYPGGAAQLVFQYVAPGSRGDDVEDQINAGLSGEISGLFGVDLSADSEFLAFWAGSPKLPSTRQVRAAA